MKEELANTVTLQCACLCVNPLSANFTKWSNTLKQIADELFEGV